MNDKKLLQLKRNATALRNIATQVLEQVEQIQKESVSAPITTRKKKDKEAVQEANVMSRILTKQSKPIGSYK